MIDIEAGRQAYNEHEISDIGWVRTQNNRDDMLTKSAP